MLFATAAKILLLRVVKGKQWLSGYTRGDYTTSRMFSRAEPTSRNDGAANGLVRVDSVGITQPVIYFPDSYGTKPFVEQRAVNRRGRPSTPVDDRDWGSSPKSKLK
ncbi:hypothetical protein CK203_006808 [Vitis vinifera]|uniref:Uncharacterized protein n=1 Tax=Vitis vinifera TaxID=29760 RepID=A0A438KCI9_VITVI|nr:hypothetical protein CK203_006808 [Vitis vinifera]